MTSVKLLPSRTVRSLTYGAHHGPIEEPPSMMYHITRFGRFIGGVLAVSIAVLAFVLVVRSHDVHFAGKRPYIVSPHETLWQIARFGTQCQNADVRQVVSKIEQMNHLRSSALQPGQHLQIPLRCN